MKGIRLKYLLFFFLLFGQFLFSQENKIIVDEKSGKPMLIGYCSREAFQDTSFSWWWKAEYDSYEVDTTTLKLLPDLSDYKIMIVMGTWCSDSRREVPRFYKILDYINFPAQDIALINVNRQKKTLRDDELFVEVNLVPTFYIFKKGKVVGEIIESPKESLEKDLWNLLK